MAIKGKRVYSFREELNDEETYWYYIANVIELEKYPDIYLEMHHSYDEGTDKHRYGYTLIKKGELPKEYTKKEQDDIEYELKYENGETEIELDELGDFCEKSWVDGTVVPRNISHDFDIWLRAQKMIEEEQERIENIEKTL